MTKRGSISKKTREAVIAAYGNACAICRVTFLPGQRIDIDHHHQLGMDGPDEVGNFRPLCVPCHKIKTKEDARARGKARRLSGETVKRRRGPPMKSRPFDKSRSRKMDGSIVRRT